MKFDVTIGNPPYLNRLYYEFLKMGHSVSDYTCMITPDSWTDNLPELEECLSNIIIYKNVDNVFNKDLLITMGVSYGLINKNKQSKQLMRIIFNNDDSDYIKYNKDHLIEIEHNILNKLNKIEYTDHPCRKNIGFLDEYTVCFKSALNHKKQNRLAYSAKVYKFGYDKFIGAYSFDNRFNIGCDSLEEVDNVLSYVFNPLMEFFLIKKLKQTYLTYRLFFDKTIKYTFDYLCDLYNITQSEKEYLKNNYGIHTNELKLTFYE
jgi:hypothetical protein